MSKFLNYRTLIILKTKKVFRNENLKIFRMTRNEILEINNFADTTILITFDNNKELQK